MSEQIEGMPLKRIFGFDKPWKASSQERYSLRRFNPNRSEDTQRYKDMDRHPRALEFMLPPRPMSRIELDESIRTNEADPKEAARLRFAIVDNSGEAVGSIQYYYDENEEELRKKASIPEDALVLEVSYKKLFTDWPNGKWWIRQRDLLLEDDQSRVALSGLRQSAILLAQKEKLISQQMHIDPRDIYISAYTNPRNIPSEKALEDAGFKVIDTETEDGEIVHTWIKKIEYPQMIGTETALKDLAG